MAPARVYIERGKRSVFAVALDWPGWCRRAKTDELAIRELDAYRARYAKVVTASFRPGAIEVIGELPGNATTDFGAPDAIGPWDREPMASREHARQIAVLQDCWSYFDAVVSDAPATLRRGPRGGGRDRDAVVSHVREAERAYGRAVGERVPPRTPWGEQRVAVLRSLGNATAEGRWPTAYAIRRVAWHILDHAWEIEDKGEPEG